MNLIETIEIKNFKSIRHQKIEGCKRVNVFIGYPNVGKSNILEALALSSINMSNLNFQANVRVEELTTLFFDGNTEKNLEIRINKNRRWIGKMFKNFIRFEEQYIKGEYFFDEIGSKLFQETKNPERCLVRISFDLKESKSKNDITQVIVENFNSPYGVEIKFNQILAPIKKYVFKKEASHSEKEYDQLINPFGDNLFSILATHNSIKKEIDELFQKYNLELLYDSRKQRFTILKRTESGIFSIPYDLVADTLQRLIFFEAAVLSNQGSILLFEEPEAHMFPPYIKKFTADVIFDKTNQFFITTHSPYVLDELIAEASNDLSVYLVDYKDGETKVYYLKEEDLAEIREYGVDLFFNIESYLKHGQINNA